VSGGQGNDTLIGTGGGNTYLYSLGDGTDTLIDTSVADGYAAFNKIVFGAGITPDQIKLSMGSLKIQVGDDPNDAIHIENFNPDDVHGSRVIDSFEFADGTVLTYDQLLERGFDIEGTEWDDGLTGTDVDDRIAAHEGDDWIEGGAGNDTYLFNLYDGYDTVYDAEGVNDAVRFGEGITLDNISIQRDGQNLWIVPNDGYGQLTLQNFVDQENNCIERFEFADGTVLSAQEMLDLAWVQPVDLYGSDDADVLVAGDGGDNLNGEGGDNTLFGGAGNDPRTNRICWREAANDRELTTQHARSAA
jgi:Ca2+-binding RTX toxin-like protein